MYALLSCVIVFDMLGKLTCSCPSNMILYNKNCISFHEEKLDPLQANEVCLKNGGVIAGTTFDIVTQLNTNPEFQKLLPETNNGEAIWVTINDSYVGSFFRLVWVALTGKSIFREVTYNKGEWKASGFVPSKKSQQFFCEFHDPAGKFTEVIVIAADRTIRKPSTYQDTRSKPQPNAQPQTGNLLKAESKYEEPERKPPGTCITRRRSKTRLSVIIKQSAGMYHVKSIAFQTRVPSVMFCTRTCLKDTNCDTLNYNPTTGSCVGYKQGKADVYENTPGWEIWSSLVK